MGYPVNNQSKVPDLPERYRYQQTIPIEVSDNIESYDRHDPQTSAADPPKIPNLPERYRQQQQSVPVQGSNDARSSQRAGFQQTIPIQLSNNFDLPPSYETAVTRPQTASQPRETRSNSQSTTGSNAQPHHNLISSAPGVSQPPQRSRSPQAHGVDIKGYLKTDPMAWDEMERNGDWDKHAGEAGCCASTSGGCCFSSRGGCCFSDREGCCFSDRQGCCFSDRGGCCFSDTAGCCFSTRGAGCCSAGPGGP